MNIRKIDKVDSAYLDFIRGFSAQLVVIGHLLSFYGLMGTYKIPAIQNFGVMIFFVLSGFLITQTTMLKGRVYGFKNFVIDRFSRIYSAYIPALFLVLLIDSIVLNTSNAYNPKYDFSIGNFIVNAFMLQSDPIFKRMGFEAFGSARPFWTVSIEWVFYLFFGLCFYFSFKKKIIHSVLSYFILGLSGITVLFYLGNRGGGLTLYWVMGFLLAYLYNDEKLNINSKSISNLLIALVSIFILYRFYDFKLMKMYDVGIALLLTIFMFLVMKSNNILKTLGDNEYFMKFSKWLASFSYSLYLIHYTLIDTLKIYLNINNVYVAIVLQFIIANIASYIFYIMFEKRHILFRAKIRSLFSQKVEPKKVVA